MNDRSPILEPLYVDMKYAKRICYCISYLVIYLLRGVWQGHCFLEDISFLIEFLALRPIIEGAGDIDI
jgi:hypothetical protein